MRRKKGVRAESGRGVQESLQSAERIILCFRRECWSGVRSGSRVAAIARGASADFTILPDNSGHNFI